MAVKLLSGALMPLVGFGTWQAAKDQAGKAVKLAVQCGYRHLDCAAIYMNEAEIGEALQEVFKEGKVKREDIFITSKLWCNSHAPEDVLPSCQSTLKNLQRDYLDLYLIHSPITFSKEAPLKPYSPIPIGYSAERMAQTWQAMEQLVEKGLCKAIGISNFSVRKMETLLETAKIVPACNQVERHPYLRQEELKKYCDSKGIVVTGYAPLGSPGRPYPDKDAKPIVLNDPVLKKIADKHETTVALVALAWGIKSGAPVLPKAVSENHIKENLEALHVNLDEDDMKAVEGIDIRFRYFKMHWMFQPNEIPTNLWDGED